MQKYEPAHICILFGDIPLSVWIQKYRAKVKPWEMHLALAQWWIMQ